MKAIKSDSKVGGNLSSLFFTFNIFLTNFFFHSTFSDGSFCNDPIHSMEFMYTYTCINAVYIYTNGSFRKWLLLMSLLALRDRKFYRKLFFGPCYINKSLILTKGRKRRDHKINSSQHFQHKTSLPKILECIFFYNNIN